MNISKYREYLVVNNNSNKYTFGVVSGDKLVNTITEHTCYIGMIETFEIYTVNPDDPSVGGWDIKHVRSTKDYIKYYPLFDCVITRNDSPFDKCEEFTSEGFKAYLNS